MTVLTPSTPDTFCGNGVFTDALSLGEVTRVLGPPSGVTGDLVKREIWTQLRAHVGAAMGVGGRARGTCVRPRDPRTPQIGSRAGAGRRVSLTPGREPVL